MPRGRPNRSGINWKNPAVVRQYQRKQEQRDSDEYKAQARAAFHAKGYGPKRRITHSNEELSQAYRDASAKALQPRRDAIAKLTPNDVKSIRRRYDAGETQTSLAAGYGITPQNINLIIKRKIWKDID